MLVRRSRFSFHANGTDIYLDSEHSVNFSQSISNNSLRWYENEKSLTFFVTFKLLFRQTIEEKNDRRKKKERKKRSSVRRHAKIFRKGKENSELFFSFLFFLSWKLLRYYSRHCKEVRLLRQLLRIMVLLCGTATPSRRPYKCRYRE